MAGWIRADCRQHKHELETVTPPVATLTTISVPRTRNRGGLWSLKYAVIIRPVEVNHKLYTCIFSLYY